MPVVPPFIPDYELFRVIGRGAYGEVWLARSVTGVYRAVKIVRRTSFTEDRPFEREFAGLRRFEPLSVGQETQVGLLHIGRNDGEGFFYYVMELADDVETGEDIFPERYVPKTLKELRTRQTRLPPAECLDIGLALTRALAHLHVNGLVHRDIKPSNVIFVHGVPKLADIGLVATMDAAHSFVGTEGFVPPEGPGTAGADVFSLGKVLYEISTGRDRNEFPQLPADLDTMSDRRALLELNEVIVRACDNDRRRRHPDAQKMREDLLLVQAGRSVRRLHVIERRVAFVIKYGVAATILLALAIAGFFWSEAQTRRARANLERAERAEQQAVQRLHEASLNWVRANRLTGQRGQRFDTLREIARVAATLHPTNRLALRNEAIACLLLPDLRPVKDWAKSPQPNSMIFGGQLRSYATNDARGNLVLRDVATDARLGVIPAEGAAPERFGFSPDERLLYAVEPANRLQIWDLTISPPRPVAMELPEGSAINGFTPDSHWFTIKHPDDSLRFINVTNGNEQHRIPYAGQPGGMHFAPDGNLLAYVEGAEAYVLRLPTGERLRTINVPGRLGALAWHPDGRRLVLGWEKGKLGMWDVASGQPLGSFEGSDSVIVGLAFTRSGNHLVSASWDRMTRIWATESFREVLQATGSGNALCVSPDGRMAYTSWDHARAHLFELADLHVAQRFDLPTLLKDRFTYRTSFHPDGSLLALASASGVFCFQPPNPVPLAHLDGEDGMMAMFQPDGQGLVTCGRLGLRRRPLAWDPARHTLSFGPPERVTPAAGEGVMSFCSSQDGRMLVAWDPDTSFVTVKLESPNSVREDTGSPSLAGHPFAANRDATLVANLSSRFPEVIQIYSVRRGLTVTNLTGFGRVTSVTFSPDDRWLTAGFKTETIAFRTTDWSVCFRVPHEPETLGNFPAAYSPDGKLLAANVADTTTLLLDAETGETLCALPTRRLQTNLTFNPAGEQLAVTDEAGGFQLWDLRHLRQELAKLNLDWDAEEMSFQSRH